jgi:DNA invertase Pin-like site-specific DNA recombinase
MTTQKRREEPMTTPIVSPAIYARVSTTDQNCAVQLADLREQVTLRKWPAAKEYVDHGWSGAKTSRPDFDRLMKAALAGEHDCVIVTKMDRFGRNVLHSLSSIAELQKAEVRFLATSQGIDTNGSNAMGRMLMQTLMIVAEFERELIAERTMAGITKKLKDGKPDSWQLKYGYRLVKGEPVPVPAEIEHVLELFHWRAKSKSWYEIADLMKQAGAKPRRSKDGNWNMTTCMEIGSSRQYIGEYTRYKRTFAMPATVPVDLWDRVQKIKTFHRNTGRPSNKYLLRKFIWCACGKRIHGMVSRKLTFYRCEGKVKKQMTGPFPGCNKSHFHQCRFVDDLVWKEVWNFLKDPVRIRRMAQALAAGRKPKNPPSPVAIRGSYWKRPRLKNNGLYG